MIIFIIFILALLLALYVFNLLEHHILAIGATALVIYEVGDLLREVVKVTSLSWLTSQLIIQIGVLLDKHFTTVRSIDVVEIDDSLPASQQPPPSPQPLDAESQKATSNKRTKKHVLKTGSFLRKATQSQQWRRRRLTRYFFATRCAVDQWFYKCIQLNGLEL